MKKQLTKQELKDKQEKKQRILKFVLRSINIICYCLSVLFLILCVAVGVQSCSNSKNNNSNNKGLKRENTQLRMPSTLTGDTFSSYYKLKFDSSVNYTWDKASFDFVVTNFVDNNIYTTAQPDVYRGSGAINGLYCYSYSSGIQPITSFTVKYSTYPNSSGTAYLYRLANIYIYINGVPFNFVTNNATQFSVNNFSINSYENYRQWEIVSNDNFAFDGDYLGVFKFSYFFETISSGIFTFNDKIAYNYFLGDMSDSVSVGFDSTSTTLNFTIYLGLFSSNGQLFDRIVFKYLYTEFAHYKGIDDLGHSFSTTINDQYYFSQMIYQYGNNGYQQVVLERYQYSNYGINATSGDLYLWLNQYPSWVNNNYKTLRIFSNYNQIEYDKLTAINNGDGMFFMGGVAVLDVFMLLSYAFTSIASFLNIMILPGITLGILLFLPLVVGLIVIIVRMVKK